MSGYALGGYTPADLDVLLKASDKLNERKQRIERLLSIVTGFIGDDEFKSGEHINVKFDLVGVPENFLWLTVDTVKKMLRLQIGRRRTPAEEDIVDYTLRVGGMSYIVSEIPMCYIEPLYKTLPQVFDVLQSAYEHLSRRIGALVAAAHLYEKPVGLHEFFGQSLAEVEYNLNVRTYNCLKYANIITVGHLVKMKQSELLEMRNFGRKELKDINEFLTSLNLRLGMTDKEMLAWNPPVAEKGDSR